VSSAVQQAPGIMRTDLQKHDLGIPGRQMIQNRVELALMAPAETIHTGRHVGAGTASELAPYLVEKRKPFLVMVDN